MSTPSVTAGFHHVTLVVRDARRSIEFYRDLLGMRLVKQTVNFDEPSAPHLFFGDDFGTPGTVVTVFEFPRSARGRWGLGSVHHLALGVETRDAQLKWKRRLEDAGFPVSGPFDRKWFHSIYFADPDGQILEIATSGPGYTVDEAIDELGSRVIVPEPEHLRGTRDDLTSQSLTHPEPVPVITADMRLNGIHHVSAITDDVERASDFYQSALGLRLVKKSVNQDFPSSPHWFWASYNGRTIQPHSAFTLFGFPDMRGHGTPGAGLMHHVAFRAGSRAELIEWREHLLGLNIDATPLLDRVYFSSIYFRAPDGLLLEIATDGPGFTTDERADALGSSLMLPSWLEGRRAELAQGYPSKSSVSS